MSEDPVAVVFRALRSVALLLVVALAGGVIWLATAPVQSNEASRGFPTQVSVAPDAGVAEVVYEPTLARVAPEAPRVIAGRMAGIYTKREADCADDFTLVADLCVHEAVQADPRSEPSIEAFRRGVAPPSVAVATQTVQWPTTIRYERVTGTAPVRSERTSAPQGDARPPATGSLGNSDAQRLAYEREAYQRREAATRDARRREAERNAEAARRERDERWRRIQVNP